MIVKLRREKMKAYEKEIVKNYNLNDAILMIIGVLMHISKQIEEINNK